MKVLHVEAGRHLYGGARQVVYLIGGLQGRGVTNLLACPPGSAIAAAATPCARIHPIPMRGDFDPGLVRRLQRLIRRTRPDLVHLHSRRGADWAGGLAARLTGTPCVLSRRVDNPEPRWLVALKYRLYDRVITISEGIRQVLLAEGVPPARLRCVHSAVDAEPFQRPCERDRFQATFGLPPDAITLGVIAQLIPRKGHRYLLQVLPELLAEYPRLHVLLFGQGPLRHTLEQDVARRGLAPHVHFTGFRTDLAEVLPCLDLVVHPADKEGLGVALLQAAAAGVPIVASRAGGIPEIVRQGENGLLVPAGDTAALRTALRTLLADPVLRHRMGQRGRAIVARDFSVDTMVDGNLTVYRELLDGRA